MGMTLKRALRVKNRLGSMLQKIRGDIRDANQYADEDPPPPIDVNAKEALDMETRIVAKLIELRAAIAKANGLIQEQLKAMSELRGRVDFLRSIPTDRGVISRRNRLFEDDGIRWDVQITKGEVDDMIRVLQMQMAEIQDELDAHNQKTVIDVDVSDELMY